MSRPARKFARITKQAGGIHLALNIDELKARAASKLSEGKTSKMLRQILLANGAKPGTAPRKLALRHDAEALFHRTIRENLGRGVEFAITQAVKATKKFIKENRKLAADKWKPPA